MSFGINAPILIQGSLVTGSYRTFLLYVLVTGLRDCFQRRGQNEYIWHHKQMPWTLVLPPTPNPPKGKACHPHWKPRTHSSIPSGVQMAPLKGSCCHWNHGFGFSEGSRDCCKSAKSLWHAPLGGQLGRVLLLISVGNSFPRGWVWDSSQGRGCFWPLYT